MASIEDFIALDVETANSDLSSICQIGLAKFENGSLASTWSSLVDPCDFFSASNTAVHGLDASSVKDAPQFPKIHDELFDRLKSLPVIIHGPFDRSALRSALGKIGRELPEIVWVDTIRVARRAWPDWNDKGYGLAVLAHRLGIDFKHHDALEDACAAGTVMLEAVKHSGISVSEWFRRSSQPVGGSLHTGLRRNLEGNADGPLFGETVVFTGALSMPRRDAASAAVKAGCAVATSVTKATTILVIGDQDARYLNGEDKSSKQRKAESLIAEGQEIRILRESDFLQVVHI